MKKDVYPFSNTQEKRQEQESSGFHSFVWAESLNIGPPPIFRNKGRELLFIHIQQIFIGHLDVRSTLFCSGDKAIQK